MCRADAGCCCPRWCCHPPPQCRPSCELCWPTARRRSRTLPAEGEHDVFPARVYHLRMTRHVAHPSVGVLRPLDRSVPLPPRLALLR
eukprot:scaffold199137_cov32-Tisochrysis_lutea.AAC.2